MKILFFNAQKFEQECFEKNYNNKSQIQIDYCVEKLNLNTTALCDGYDGIVSFVNDCLDKKNIELLAKKGVKSIFLRSAGYNHVDLNAARQFNLPVYRVPAYSPEAVAEHSLALLMTLNRKTHKAYARVREMNFSLEGLVGFNLQNKVVGIVGTGKIGRCFAKIISGFGCKILLFDIEKDEAFAQEVRAQYVTQDEIIKNSDILSFHCPLNESTHHFINENNIADLKKNVILVNTSRGAIIATTALIKGLKSQHIGGAALDVYEYESELFFADHSSEIIQDDTIARLMSFPNVLITSHQGFLTHEALNEIAKTTLNNIEDFIVNGSQSKSLNKV